MVHFLQKTIIILTFILLFWGETHAASLYFSSSQINFHKDENFTVSVFVNAEVSVNAIQGIVIFPTDKLGALSTQRDNNSVIDLWVRNPSFSNAGETGNVTFEGIILNPGYVGEKGKIIDIVFRAKREGMANLSFKDFAILANDGNGTNVSTTSGTATFKILPTQPVSEKSLKPEGTAPQVVIIKEPGISSEIMAFWEVFPKWVQVSVLVLVGVAALILALIVLSFGLVLIVWILNHMWRQRTRLASTMRMAEKEFESDVSYAARQLKHDFKEAKDYRSLDKVVKDYWISLKNIVRRFFTKNL